MALNKNMNDLEKKIKEAVKPYMGMPIALSGGIDSGLLAALIKPKFAITAIIPGEDERFNELKYAKIVVQHLGIKHIVVEIDDSKFEESVRIAVKAIGRPIPHFNIFPLYEMYKAFAQMGEKEIVLGDGADETMCGYARDLIIHYLYKIYDFEAFKNYRPIIDKILPPLVQTVETVIGKKPINGTDNITLANVLYMRPDMDDMANGIAKYFGITNYRPYQDNKELDNYMFTLPMKDKIKDVEYGKYALRKIAEKYLPKEIAWRKTKVGGIVYPVNTKMGWLENGEFDKSRWLKYQEDILKL